MTYGTPTAYPKAPTAQQTPQPAPNPIQSLYAQAGHTTQPYPGGIDPGARGIPWDGPDNDAWSYPVPGYPVDDDARALPWDDGGYGDDGRALPAPDSPTGGGSPAPRPGGGTPQVPGSVPFPDDPLRTAAQQQLLALLQQLGQPVSISDPNLAPAADAFRSSQQRSTERQRQALAERLHAEGTATGGGLTTGILGLEADAGNRQAAFESDLVLQEMRDRRDQLMQALQMAEAAGQFSVAQQIQQQLAVMDLGLRERLGMGQLDLGWAGLDLQRELGRGDLSLRDQALALQRLLGGGDLALRRDALGQQGDLARLSALLQLYGIGINNDQFNSRLGFDYNQLLALMNRWATEAFL